MLHANFDATILLTKHIFLMDLTYLLSLGSLINQIF